MHIQCYSNELYHYGVPGMKWGVRRYQPYTNKSGTKYGVVDTLRRNRLTKSNESIQRDIDSFKPHKNGIKTKSGKVVLTKQDVSNSVRGLKNVQDKNKEKIRKIDSKYKDKNYVAKREARNKAIKTGAKVAAAILVAGAAAYTISRISKNNYNNHKQLSDVYKRYGNTTLTLANEARSKRWDYQDKAKLAGDDKRSRDFWDRQAASEGANEDRHNFDANIYYNVSNYHRNRANNTLYGRYVNSRKRR